MVSLRLCLENRIMAAVSAVVSLWDEARSCTKAFNRVHSMITAGSVRPQTFEDYTDEKRRAHSALGMYRIDVSSPSHDNARESALHCSRSLNQLSSLAVRSLDHISQRPRPMVDIDTKLSNVGSVEMLNAVGEVEVPHTCSACSRKLLSSDVVVVFEEDVVHLACFCCGRCGEEVDASRDFLVLEDNSPLCYDCSPVCHSCSRKIVTDHVGVLNKDFHEGCLKCYQCQKPFTTVTKVYSSAGEPCCAECITPVFDKVWSRQSSAKRDVKGTIEDHNLEILLVPPQNLIECESCQPATLQAASRTVRDFTSRKYHSLLRPSNSAPTLGTMSNSSSPSQMIGLSSLEAILYDEAGASLFMNFCVEDNSVEQVVFWLDVEHFKHFEGDACDVKIFAHHIMLKYVGYYAELPIGLPKCIEDGITSGIQSNPFCRDTFDEAQQHVYEEMERNLLPRFLQSREGLTYLEAIVRRDIDRRHRRRQVSGEEVCDVVRVTVKSFDKRLLEKKFYVYEMEVETEEAKYMIYRRYGDFLAMHSELRSMFPKQKFSVLPKRKILGRSQTRAVAQHRMRELQTYIQSLLAMNVEVSKCLVVGRFFTQTATDREDMEYNSRIMEVQQQAIC